MTAPTAAIYDHRPNRQFPIRSFYDRRAQHEPLMTDKITVADALLSELERIGVDTVFGIISIHNIPFYDALERHGGFRVVTARHEGTIVNITDAYSRVSGKLGVAL